MVVKIRSEYVWKYCAPQEAEAPAFALLRPPRLNIFSFLGSLVLHVSTVWLVASTIQAVNLRRAEARDSLFFRALQMPAVTISRPVFYKPEENTESVKTPGEMPGPPKTAEAALPTPAGSGAAPEPTPRPEQRRFQTPPEIVRKAERQILVQLDEAPDLKPKPKAALPEVMLWQLPAPPKPQKQIVAAHREEIRQVTETPPELTPQLNARNLELELAELRHAAAPEVPAPKAPLAVTNTIPIRVLDGPMGNHLPNSTGATVATPQEVHVISIPDIPVPAAANIVLPAGSYAPLSAAYSGVRGPGTGGQSGISSSTQPGQAPGAAEKATSRGVSGPGGELARDHGSGSLVKGPGAAVGGSAPPPEAVRIERPRDGKYNVVVMGASNLSAYPEAAGILSGKLIYSVYIRAGGRKEWILQYCLPKAVEQTVRLRGSAVPIEAPYPFVMYHLDSNLLNDPDYVIVHGFITVAGRFENLSAIGDIDPKSKDLLISALQSWEFRPASRDGEPSAVEIALIIPREPAM